MLNSPAQNPTPCDTTRSQLSFYCTWGTACVYVSTMHATDVINSDMLQDRLGEHLLSGGNVDHNSGWRYVAVVWPLQHAAWLWCAGVLWTAAVELVVLIMVAGRRLSALTAQSPGPHLQSHHPTLLLVSGRRQQVLVKVLRVIDGCRWRADIVSAITLSFWQTVYTRHAITLHADTWSGQQVGV